MDQGVFFTKLEAGSRQSLTVACGADVVVNAYRAEVTDGQRHLPRIIVGFEVRGLGSSIGYLSPGEARAMAEMLMAGAMDAEAGAAS